ncbi:MAG: FAD-dependent oxidoreductase, partial [Actinomycetota bacterium]
GMEVDALGEKMKVVVVGNGNAGAALVDGLLAKDADGVEITLYGDEEVGTYDRVRLSEYMAGAVDLEGLGMRPDAWYEERNVRFRRGVRVEEVDTKGRRVMGADGEWVPYDRLIFATGASASVPPIEGRDKEGVFVFRTVRDVEEMLEAAPEKSVVIGGGLLGLEAAYGLATRGSGVTVLHRSGHLMSQQLDPAAGRMLGRQIEKLGIDFRLNAHTEEIMGKDRVQGVMLRSGEYLPAEMVVICTGIRPNRGLAGRAGVRANRGILVNEHMETSVENVYAVGECTEYEGQLIGLVAPAMEQVRVVVDTILGKRERVYRGHGAATTLKVAGVDLVSAGDAYGREEDCEAIVSSNPLKGVYRKAVVKDGHVTGAILLGDVSAGPQLTEAVKRRMPAEEVAGLIIGDVDAAAAPLDLPDDAQVCDCMGVSKGQIVQMIRKEDLKSVSEVGEATKAGTSCGSCKPLVKTILEEAADGPVEEEKAHLCKCMGLTHADLRSIVKECGLRSVSEVGETCGAGKACPDCKVGLTYIVSEVNANRHEEERHA